MLTCTGHGNVCSQISMFFFNFDILCPKDQIQKGIRDEFKEPKYFAPYFIEKP